MTVRTGRVSEVWAGYKGEGLKVRDMDSEEKLDASSFHGRVEDNDG